ncbi:MAG: hypothetical protein ABI600_03065 [Luteolibacter sp.]
MPERPDYQEISNNPFDVEQVRAARNKGFRDCIDAIPEMGSILSKCSEIGWKAFEEKCCEYLLARLAGTPADAESKFKVTRELHHQVDFEGGDEHHLALSANEEARRVFKWTYGNNFGLLLKVYEIDPQGMNQNVISSGNPDPCYYLRRWIILKNIGPPVTRFEGLLPPDFLNGERLPRLSISQRMLPPENPSYQEIINAFHKIGFIEVAENAYYRENDNILLGDAAPRNVRIVNGVIIPFDAVAEQPSGNAKEWCGNEARKRL